MSRPITTHQPVPGSVGGNGHGQVHLPGCPPINVTPGERVITTPTGAPATF